MISNASFTNSGAEADVASVVEALAKCPAWSDAEPKAKEILVVCEELSQFDSEILRAAIDRFVKRCQARKEYDIANMSKLFVLNRYIFRVPPSEKFSGPFFGGWDGVPYNEKEMNMLWPLSVPKPGELALTGKYAGYGGEPFRAVQEFDFFLKKYKRRHLPPHKP